tara:strand:- start:153 stop:278 length:126 start_codon:yes stop_codon:yes gene_type:complete
MAIDWDAYDPFGEEEEPEDVELDVDDQIKDMKIEGNWPWWK